jgi:hypothetical protein
VIPLQACAGFYITVANDDRLMSPGCCQGLRINIDGEAFNVNCYVLALASFDIVLGIQWLESLGLILWDFGF